MTPLSAPGPRARASSGRRRGTRRSTWWRPASREALDDDPATVVPYLYNSSAGELGAGLLGPLLWDALGASQVDLTICAATTGLAWAMTFGGMAGADPLDVVHSQLVVVWGANPSISNTHFPPLVQHARRNGAALVVVDPRRTGDGQAGRPAPRRPTGHRRRAGHGRRPRAASSARRSTATSPTPTPTGSTSTSRPAQPWTLDRAAEECGVGRRPTSTAFVDLLVDRRPAFWRTGLGDGAQPQRWVRRCGRCFALPVLTGAFGRLGSGVHLHTDHDLDWDHAALLRRGARAGRASPGPHRGAGRAAMSTMNRLGQLLVDPGDGAGRAACWSCRAPTRRS